MNTICRNGEMPSTLCGACVPFVVSPELEFRGKTAHRFGDSEIEENQEWFTGGEQFKKDGTVKFFGVWMSRDSLYIAPRDAQEQIIRKWKRWYETKGVSFAYPPFKNDPDIWYF